MAVRLKRNSFGFGLGRCSRLFESSAHVDGASTFKAMCLQSFSGFGLSGYHDNARIDVIPTGLESRLRAGTIKMFSIRENWIPKGRRVKRAVKCGSQGVLAGAQAEYLPPAEFLG